MKRKPPLSREQGVVLVLLLVITVIGARSAPREAAVRLKVIVGLRICLIATECVWDEVGEAAIGSSVIVALGTCLIVMESVWDDIG